MATRSFIGILNKDDSVDYIYCHWDGYVAGVGKVLQEHYTSEKKIDKLLALGDISSLGPKIGRKHAFDNYDIARDNGWTTAYGRDRGEDCVDPHIHEGPKKWMNDRRGNGCEYAYIWDGTKWGGYNLWTNGEVL